MRVVLTAVLSVAIHVLFGWAWTLIAGVLGGAMATERGWLVGMTGVGAAWAGVLGYSYGVAPEPTSTMLGVLGAMAGNIPGVLFVVASLLIGVLLGLFGGLIGAQLMALTRGDG